jgi:hypothetical protein
VIELPLLENLCLLWKDLKVCNCTYQPPKDFIFFSYLTLFIVYSFKIIVIKLDLKINSAKESDFKLHRLTPVNLNQLKKLKKKLKILIFHLKKIKK